jgi:TPR repeat protein
MCWPKRTVLAGCEDLRSNLRRRLLWREPDAQAMLAACLHNGEGVKQNFDEAAKWFLKAAELGSAEAQYQIALYCIEGRSVPKDYVQAYVFLSMTTTRATD